VLTFDEFLSIEPCTEGQHSTTDRPPAIEKREAPADAALLEASQTPPPPPRVPVATAPQLAAATAPPADEPEPDDDPDEAVPDGAACRRKGCGATYAAGTAGQRRDKDEHCVHHPGAPIFHEGSKGYSCCKRRVLEFSEFLKIEGCQTKSRHRFLAQDADKVAKPAAGGAGEELLETVR
jgi:hypothetical protein